MRFVSRRVAGALASLATAATLLVAPAAASAQASLPEMSSGVEEMAGQVGFSQDDLRESAWQTRNTIHQQTNVLHPQTANAIRGAVDGAVEGVFPGLINEKIQASRPAPAPAAVPAAAPIPQFDYGSCPKDAKACVDLDGRRTWLQNNGQVYYGDVFHGPGRAGHETPRGTYFVNRKVKDEISWEFNNAPMPNAVYFTYNGHAFHAGDPNILSHGCVRLNYQDSVKFFNDLQIGDKVYIY